MKDLPLTNLVNEGLGSTFGAFARLVHISRSHPALSDATAMELLIACLLLILFVALRLSLSVEKPNVLQLSFEILHEFIGGLATEIIGSQSARFTTFLSTLFVFILFLNLMGAFPGLQSPTLTITVPLGITIVTWVYYHAQGIREHRWSYVKQFLGPVGWLTPLMFPLELNTHCSRLMSLTVRLWANMFAGELLIRVFFSLFPVGLPIGFMALHIAVGILQAYIFLLLATVYIGLAVAHDH